ncbi:hypothetical protein R1sor_007643 [Riccia sorocarpa]|uniref:HTH CENPB-type domain-containing protein n=1 Tax=Riccia sorocarpa TaxID=122646 RepID=A0ABD3HR27_9MARC
MGRKELSNEETFFAWFSTMQEANVTMSDEMLITKARMLQNSVLRETEKEIKFSNGWLQGFKRHHKIQAYVRHGEGASAEITEDVLDRIEALKALISGYEPDDIFNMDETGLFWQLEPNRTLATRAVSGKKKSKNRFTVALTSNMTGTVKLPPFIIHKFSNPRAFARRNIRRPENLGIVWHSNSKAWMTMKLFEQYLLDFEKRLKESGRSKVLLLLDNFAGHKVISVGDRISIIRIEFLPPNVTAVFQPMDAGIIRAFKAHYRRLLIRLKLERLQAPGSAEVDVYDAVLMIEKAWRVDVTSKTIRNCWIHAQLVSATGILPDLNASDDQYGAAIDPVRDLRSALIQLEEMTMESGIIPNMTADEYIDFENATEALDPISVEELADLVSLPEADTLEEAEPDIDLDRSPPLSVYELNAACSIVLCFLEQSQDDKSRITSKLKSMLEEVQFGARASLIQREITTYFSSEL